MFNTFGTPWTVAHQAPLSMGFLRQIYWSGLPFPSPGNLPDPGMESVSPALAHRFFTTEPLREACKVNGGDYSDVLGEENEVQKCEIHLFSCLTKLC